MSSLSLQVGVLWPAPHLSVNVKEPVRSQDHPLWVNLWSNLFKDAVDEGVELGHVRDALFSSVQFLQVMMLDH